MLRIFRDHQAIDVFPPSHHTVSDPDGVTLHVYEGDQLVKSYAAGEWHAAGDNVLCGGPPDSGDCPICRFEPAPAPSTASKDS